MPDSTVLSSGKDAGAIAIPRDGVDAAPVGFDKILSSLADVGRDCFTEKRNSGEP